MSKVVHIVMAPELLEIIDAWRARLHMSRSELVRKACRQFIVSAEEKAYAEAYLRTPETADTGEAQAAVLGEVVGQEERVNATR